MNILILSSGSRVKLVEYFKEEFNRKGFKVYTADCSELAPTLYVSDGYFIVPRITEPFYIDEIIDICKKNNIGGVLSLIDPELALLSKNKEKLKSEDITAIVSDLEYVNLCFDKFEMFQFLKKMKIDTPFTFNSKESIETSLEKGEIKFPLFAKPVCGSASLNMRKINSDKEFRKFDFNDNFIIQEFIEGNEYGVDVYIDTLTGEIIEIFIKEKILMRAGETDKSISIESKEIENLVKKLLSKLNLRGAIDIDIFEKNGVFMVSEVNPRFGGGYLHAQESGCTFIKYILNNLEKKENIKSNRMFKKNIMMKYSDIVILEKED